MPGLSFSTDIITGFCGESEEEFNDTLKVIEEVKFE
jgi:tRNA-2-methylthio-N6-dimethylallyladenosine synthase